MACFGALRTFGAPAPLTFGVRQHMERPRRLHLKIRLSLLFTAIAFAFFAYFLTPQKTQPRSSLHEIQGVYKIDTRDKSKYWELASIFPPEGKEVRILIPRRYRHLAKSLQNQQVSVLYKSQNNEKFALEIISSNQTGFQYEQYIQDASSGKTLSYIFRGAFAVASLVCALGVFSVAKINA
jgi:hypothetical protein